MRLTLFFLLVFFTTAACAQRPPDIELNADIRRDVVNGIIKRANQFYLSAEVGQKVETGLQDQLRSGSYDRITSAFDFMDALDADLFRLSKDAHLKVAYSHNPSADPASDEIPAETPEDWVEGRREAEKYNYGFEKLEIMPGNVGMLRLGRFVRPAYGGDMAGTAFTFLANTDALIIDLRTCRGGSLDMVIFLASYFFPAEEPVFLGEMDCRAENMNQQYWTYAYLPGPRYLDKDVFLLMSQDTFSAPEGLASFLQHHKRATIVGEKTRGGTHPGMMVRVHPHFAVFVPMSRPIYPSGTPRHPIGRPVFPDRIVDHEGTGVTPDIAVAQDKALKTAHLEALTRKLNRSPGSENELRPLIEKLSR